MSMDTELERERMRLAACGVVAMADTPESAQKARDMKEEYRSASCEDVARRVDECMALRAERDALAARLAELEGQEPVAWVEVVSTHEGPYNFQGMALLGKGNHLLYARPVPAEMSPEFTDTARSALLWVLWHHQGGSSPVGQPIRQALGMDAHERLSERQVQEAKKWAAISGAKTNDFHRSEPVNARLLEALSALLDDIEALIGESAGVYGLHLNVYVSPWSELEEGGRFERLSSMSRAREAIAAAEAQQERLLQDMHDAGREIDRVMAESAPKAPQVDFEAIARAIWNVRREGEDRCDMELEDLGTDHSVWEEASEVASILEDAGIEVAE